MALYRERIAKIARTGPYIYIVPFCSRRGSWAVNYARETCDCPNTSTGGNVHPHLRREDRTRQAPPTGQLLAHEPIQGVLPMRVPTLVEKEK